MNVISKYPPNLNSFKWHFENYNLYIYNFYIYFLKLFESLKNGAV